MSNAETQTPIEADITNGQKMRVSNVRINGDIIGADGKPQRWARGLNSARKSWPRSEARRFRRSPTHGPA